MISVIIPTYNTKIYIDNAIDSVLNQTYKNFEIIVVDDGSTDGTSEYLADKYSNQISLIKQNNGGLANARNTGIINSKGDLIQFLDADDVLEPQKFEKSIKKIEEGYDIVSCWCVDMDESLIKTIKIRKPFDHTTNHIEEVITHNSIGVVHGPIFKREIIDKYQIFMDNSLGNYCADWYFWLRIIFENPKIGIIEEVLCKYRRHSNSLTKSSFYLNSVGDKNVVSRAIEIIENYNYDDNLITKAKNEYGRRIYECLKYSYSERYFMKFIYHVFESLLNKTARKLLLDKLYKK